MMVPAISVFKRKNMLFSCVLACLCMQTCFTIYHWHTELLSIRLELFISPKLVLRMSSIFFQKQTNDSYRFIGTI